MIVRSLAIAALVSSASLAIVRAADNDDCENKIRSAIQDYQEDVESCLSDAATLDEARECAKQG